MDADDDDAMADYASRFYSDLMMTVDHEEVLSEDDIPISLMRRSPLPAERYRRKGLAAPATSLLRQPMLYQNALNKLPHVV
jgi:hypothetical protein